MLPRRKLLALILAVSTTIGPYAALAAPQVDEKKKGGGISYIQFRTLTATVFRPDGRRGVLTVEAGVDVPAMSNSWRPTPAACPRAYRPTPTTSPMRCRSRPTRFYASLARGS
jgi:hypothetical protein